jgi:hypothetical protein
MSASPLVRLRRLCLAFPESHEVEAWGAPTFRVRNKLFAMYSSVESSHSGGRPAVWVKAIAENQRLMVDTWPKRFFVPPYVGPSGWVGVWLDDVTDWAELVELLRDAWLRTAPKRLAAVMVRDESVATHSPSKAAPRRSTAAAKRPARATKAKSSARAKKAAPVRKSRTSKRTASASRSSTRRRSDA